MIMKWDKWSITVICYNQCIHETLLCFLISHIILYPLFHMEMLLVLSKKKKKKTMWKASLCVI